MSLLSFLQAVNTMLTARQATIATFLKIKLVFDIRQNAITLYYREVFKLKTIIKSKKLRNKFASPLGSLRKESFGEGEAKFNPADSPNHDFKKIFRINRIFNFNLGNRINCTEILVRIKINFVTI